MHLHRHWLYPRRRKWVEGTLVFSGLPMLVDRDTPLAWPVIQCASELPPAIDSQVDRPADDQHYVPAQMVKHAVASVTLPIQHNIEHRVAETYRDVCQTDNNTGHHCYHQPIPPGPKTYRPGLAHGVRRI